MTLLQIEAPPSYDEHDMIGHLRELYERAKESKGNLLTEWKRNYRITMNRAAPAVPNAPGVRANEVFPTVDSRIGWMTDQEIQFSVTPAADPFSLWYMVNDTLGEQLESLLNSNYKSQGWYAEVVRMLWDAAMYGVGFLKATWDAGLEPPLGNVSLKCTSPWCLYIDPFATNLDDANYVIEVHTMTPSEIERKFPDTSAALLEEITITGDTNSEHIPPNQASNRQKAGNLIPIDAGQGPTTWGQPGGARTHRVERVNGVNVYECWFRDNYREEVESADPTIGKHDVVSDQWRVVVWSGNRVLLDEWAENLFHDDRHPYVRYADVETGELWGSPLLRDLAPCQQAMNTLLAMGQNSIVMTGNPIMIGVKGSGVDRATFKNVPGAIFDVNGGPQGGQTNRPDWLNPPNLPPNLMDFVKFWREEMERIAGLGATQRGEVPSGRATEKQVQGGQEAGFIRIRSASRNLELTLGKAGELLANLIIINYDTPRIVAIVGEDGEMASIRLAAQHFYAPTPGMDGKATFAPMRFTMTVGAGSSKPTSRAARIAEANTLKAIGVVDNLYVAQAYRISHAREVVARAEQEQQQQAQMQQFQKGQQKGSHPK